jgi:hypothetical protein
VDALAELAQFEPSISLPIRLEEARLPEEADVFVGCASLDTANYAQHSYRSTLQERPSIQPPQSILEQQSVRLRGEVADGKDIERGGLRSYSGHSRIMDREG